MEISVRAMADRKVIHGDSFDMANGLPSLAAGSAAATITDPPYSEWTHAKLGKEKRSDGHAAREKLDFKPLTKEEIAAYGAELCRVTSGWIVIFTDDRSLSAWGSALEAGGGRWVRTGAWVKSNPMPQVSGDRPAVGFEPIVIGYATTKGRMRWNGGGQVALWRGSPDPERVHPTQKPLWLMRQLVELFSNVNQLVIDPFAGSGSTGAACLATRRRFLGWEIAGPMAGIAQARVNGESPIDPHQPDLFQEKKAYERERQDD